MNQNYESFVRSYVEHEEKQTGTSESFWKYIYAIIFVGFLLIGFSAFTNILPATVNTVLSIIGTLMSSLILVVFWDLYQKMLKQINIDDITDISTETMA